jgi:hypothetical protein
MSQMFLNKIKLKIIQGNQNIIINQQGDRKNKIIIQNIEHP